MLIAFLAIVLVIAVQPPPCGLPDREACSLAHGFVIGEAPFLSGNIEIWNCRGRTIVALNQIRGLPADSGPVTRAYFCPDVGSGERLMGCRGENENFDGTVAIADAAGGNRPKLRKAWEADTANWKFLPTDAADLVCNRGLAVEQ